MIDRRALLKQSGAVVAALGTASIFDPLRAFADTVTLPFDNGERPLVKYPQKRPMIGVTSRPPQLETPFAVFNGGPITPNDAFFVRYHLAGIPLEINPDTFRVVLPDFSLAPSATLVMNERTVKRLIGMVDFGAVPGSTHPHAVSGIR